MRKNAYKDILNFLIEVSHIAPQGHHLRRLQSMASLVHSCIKVKSCTLEGLSQPRQTCRATFKDSLLQQTKRWLCNKWVDWESFFLPLARHFLSVAAGKGELVLIIDGSQTGSTNTTLMVSVLCRGFAIPLVWVVKKGAKGHFSEQMHLDLLNMLLPAMPQDCRVVLLGDGEFDGEQLLAWCAEQKWEFVLRTSCDRQVDFGAEQGRIDALSMPKGHTSLFLPDALPGLNAVFWHEKRFEKPIFLLTNMDVGKMACQYYKRRFKIETMFKQLKSRGFQLHKTMLKCPLKISNLIVVAATAFILTFCLGCFIKHKCDEKTLRTFVRKKKIDNKGFINIAQICWVEAFHVALLFFSELSKNFNWVFT
jgi:hypothetical protein